MTRIMNVVDTGFAHDISIVAGRPPKFWVWDRALANSDRPTFYTHEKIFEAPSGRSHIYAILLESKAFLKPFYDYMPAVMDRFDYVFTHDKELLDLRPDKCRFIPGGGLWIGGSYGQGQAGIYPKTRLVSMVSSTKTMCPLHILRLDIARTLASVPQIDVFIGGGGRGTPGWVPIFETLRDHMYSIVMENWVDENYFTEKILNCFATGTVPIYLGARQIGKFFNGDGIISFNSWGDLVKILPTLSSDDYQKRSVAIMDNYRRCQDYDCIEDYIERHYSHLLPPAI